MKITEEEAFKEVIDPIMGILRNIYTSTSIDFTGGYFEISNPHNNGIKRVGIPKGYKTKKDCIEEIKK